MGERATRDILWRPSSPRADLARYALAGLVVLSAAAAAAVAADRLPDGDMASETEDAVLLDLPPAPASSVPPSEAADGPEQQAIDAAAAVAPAQEVTPPQRVPDDPAPPVAPQADVAVPKPAEPPAPPPPETPPPETPPPPPVEKPPVEPPAPPVAATAAQEEMAPAGSQAPVKEADAIDSEAARRRAARAMNRWQQAMLLRLQTAKSGMRSGGDTGTVTLAFTIDQQGRLLASRVTRGSGSSHLDQLALALLGRAAPFPAPPAGASALSFTVPVAFTHRR